MEKESAGLLATRHLYLCQRYTKETDTIERMHWEHELKDVEDALRQCARSEVTTAFLKVLQPYVAQATSSPTDRAGALRTWRFLESLYEIQLRQTRHGVAEQETLPTDLEGLIGILRDLREERRRQAMANILGHGFAAIPELNAALSRNSSPLVQARILYLLAMLRDVRLMPHVWKMHQEALTSEVRELLEKSLLRMAQTLETAPQTLPLSELINLFIACRWVFPTLADSLAQVLITLAKTAPTMELRAVLPYLQGAWLRPLSAPQREARTAIEASTKNLSQLPVPADITAATQNLPVPSDTEIVPNNLPLPEDSYG